MLTAESKELLSHVVDIAKAAGEAVLEVYSTDFSVEVKTDESPVTLADLAAHKIISRELARLTPDIPILSEEDGLPEWSVRRHWPVYWLVDPLDGTKEFVNRNDEFTVNIALISGHQSVLGVVCVPVTQTTYAADVHTGAWIQERDGEARSIKVAKTTGPTIRAVGSRSHASESLVKYYEILGSVEQLPMGSSLKFCRIAEDKADIYPRLGLTSEWDTAAAQAIVEQAGGAVVKLDGTPLQYNAKEDILNPHFLVYGPDDKDWLGLLAKALD